MMDGNKPRDWQSFLRKVQGHDPNDQIGKKKYENM